MLETSFFSPMHKATPVRMAHEWLLTPIMVFQNYHLIHHLYASIPFYRYKKVRGLKRIKIMIKNVAIQRGYRLSPMWRS